MHRNMAFRTNLLCLLLWRSRPWMNMSSRNPTIPSKVLLSLPNPPVCMPWKISTLTHRTALCRFFLQTQTSQSSTGNWSVLGRHRSWQGQDTSTSLRSSSVHWRSKEPPYFLRLVDHTSYIENLPSFAQQPTIVAALTHHPNTSTDIITIFYLFTTTDIRIINTTKPPPPSTHCQFIFFAPSQQKVGSTNISTSPTISTIDSLRHSTISYYSPNFHLSLFIATCLWSRQKAIEKYEPSTVRSAMRSLGEVKKIINIFNFYIPNI